MNSKWLWILVGIALAYFVLPVVTGAISRARS